MSRFPVLSRGFVALGALAAASLAASGCAGDLDDAATVTLSAGGGVEKTVVHITRDDLEDDLRVMRANDGFVEFLKENGIEIPESDASIGSAVTAIWLSDLINQAVIDAELHERDLEVTEEDRDTVSAQIAESYGGEEIFKQFPKEFRTTVVERAAAWNALLTRGVGEAEPPTEEDARKFYEENAEQIGACPSGRSVAHVLVATEVEAQEVLAELDGGSTFAAVAEEQSTDPTAADNGGELGCLQDGAFVAPFEEAAKAATLGEPTQPVETEYGFHVILVTEYQAPSFEELKDQILEYLAGQAEQSGGQEMNTIIQERLGDADVDVDPRYGEWIADDEQGPHVQAPDSPDPAEGRDGGATTTVAPLDPLAPVPVPEG